MTKESNTALVARVVDGQKPLLSKENIPIPSPAPNQVLVRVSHVAQNPTDVKSFDRKAFGDGAVYGCDFVGEVVELGSDVTRYTKGDVVAAFIRGGAIKGLGAYSQYCVAEERISFIVSTSIPRQCASTIPLAAATAWLALFSKSCLALDRQQAENTSVLIWGGGSSVGLYAVQLAAMHGFDVVTTCSPRNAALIRSYGAKHVFDYSDDKVAAKIREVAPSLKHIFDTIGSTTSSVTASLALCKEGGDLCTVQPGKANTEGVAAGTRVTDVLVWMAFLKDQIHNGLKWPASKENHELASELFEKLLGWLEQGTIRPNSVKLLHGLDAVEEGFQEYRDKKISAYKLVYEL
ncbi:zinc-binding alcohol dehydrogenase family protein [Aspergillus clavatus NRRL 1]|uniref:Zinc-binding dehydrogenase family oxidoreductase, putative n=1 Tax=Aspergillus clavatus (strain ATCC 1007 / CBS 513.65 / DSM 816 / NCTC 3887 / NRRL 1 / QM 1276 / 107) TaxID=344612 RepID=A1CCJ3_ASPCL|nr:zinc-binding dehydrogenase family oxidoreductase, putative [Aspergillus clavatus NRRL 1]EAW12250.1 zinc-binding dehydrogenase family oxidoreductase, putative [Aspergillus clavatus NRRL 1]